MRHSIKLIDNKFQNLNILPKSSNSSSNASTSSLDWWWEIGTMAWSQFCEHTKFWTMRGDSELRNGSTMWPPMLNADSDATVETSTASTSLATLDNTWYQLQLSLHYSNISKFTSFLPSQFSAKYFSTSLLQPHHIWITSITFQFCPLTPTLFLHIWWMNRRVKIIQLIQKIFHLIIHHFCHYIPINFRKRKLQKPQFFLVDQEPQPHTKED